MRNVRKIDVSFSASAEDIIRRFMTVRHRFTVIRDCDSSNCNLASEILFCHLSGPKTGPAIARHLLEHGLPTFVHAAGNSPRILLRFRYGLRRQQRYST
jgi:hypothetical protein